MGTKIDLDSLSEAEKARLPGRIRALERDEWTIAWADAKAERDAAIEAVTVRTKEEQVDADGNPYVTELLTYSDPEAVAAARGAWETRKAELLASAPKEE